MRVIAAIALVTAAAALGFISGRMSAWLVPVAQTETAVVIREVARAAPVQLQSQPDPPVASRQEPDPFHDSVAHANLAPNEVTPPENDNAGPNVTVINRGWEYAQPAASQAAPEAKVEVEAFDRHAVGKCERRFNSFRVKDGTYQPYGRGSRELCPFLREQTLAE